MAERQVAQEQHYVIVFEDLKKVLGVEMGGPITREEYDAKIVEYTSPNALKKKVFSKFCTGITQEGEVIAWERLQPSERREQLNDLATKLEPVER